MDTAPEGREETNAMVVAKPIAPTAAGLLNQIRPYWRSKSLIERVERLVEVDLGSACQRLLNAAFEDLREKIVIAGMDLAQDAANAYKLPPVTRPDDVLDSYSNTNILDLAYYMGLMTKPEWRRLRRSYEIRRDLEHEDDEYEAQLEDYVYVFKTSIEIVLSRDPVELLRVDDVRELIESPEQATPSADFLEDYGKAPAPRQQVIMSLLVSTVLDANRLELVRKNAYDAVRAFGPQTRREVKLELAEQAQSRAKRRPLTPAEMKVANAADFLPYLRRGNVDASFEAYAKRLAQVSPRWDAYLQHDDVLDDLEDLGGLSLCPQGPRLLILEWLILCYIGERGGYGTYGRNRPVFYSDVAAPRIERIIRGSANLRADFEQVAKSDAIQDAISDKYAQRRLDDLADLVVT